MRDLRVTIIVSLILSMGLGLTFYFLSPLPQAHRNLAGIQNTALNYENKRKGILPKHDSPFRQNKFRLGKKFQQKLGALGVGITGQAAQTKQFTLPRGTALSALVDQDCVQQNVALPARVASSNFQALRRPGRNDEHHLKFVAETIILDAATNSQELKNEITADPCVVGMSQEGFVHKNAIFYTDPSTNLQNQLAAIEAVAAEQFFYFSSLINSVPVRIAIVDTGIDYGHQDLAGQMWRNSNGQYGYDFMNKDTDPFDDNGHGTHVAGLVAAAGNNGVGGSGVKGKYVELMVVKVLDSSGSGTMSALANGIYYAVDNGAQVINMSLSGDGESSVVEDALTYAINHGVVVMVAAGNDNQAIDGGSHFQTPASYAKGLTGMLAIGSIDAVTLKRSYFSNYGTSFVELSAPGSNGIYSTWPKNSYKYLEGTSMATPVAAGAAALVIGALRAQNILYTAADVENILTTGAVKNSNLTTYFKSGNQLSLPTAAELLRDDYVTDLAGGIEVERE